MQEARRRERLIDMRNIVGKMIVLMHRTLAMATAAVFVLLSPAAGQTAQPGTHVGMLTCQMAPRTGLTVGPVQSIRCHFVPDGGYPQQAYMGELATVGLDVGITTGGVLAWDVLVSTGGSPAGDLAGVYVGANGDIPVGVGIDANVLFGGSNRTIALQPLALEGEIEVALGEGLSSLKLAAIRDGGHNVCSGFDHDSHFSAGHRCGRCSKIRY
jgi:hypothetical protein